MFLLGWMSVTGQSIICKPNQFSDKNMLFGETWIWFLISHLYYLLASKKI